MRHYRLVLNWRWQKTLAVSLVLSLVAAGILLPVSGVFGSPGAAISGRVYNVINDAPLVGATVTADSLSATTDTNGDYIFSDVPTGTYNLTASFSGFRSRTINSLPVSEGQSLTQNIALTPSSIEVGSIGGFVVNAMSGSQLGGVKVSLGDGMVKHTDGYGRYSIDDVPIGYPFTITATAYSGYLPRSVSLIRAGEGMDFALMPEGFTPGSISGTVTRTDNGAAIAEAWVRAGFGLVARTASDGTYTLDNLPEGDYYLQAHKATFESATAQLNLTGGGSPTQDFTLKPNASAGWVWGYVTNVTNGNRIDGAVISVAEKTVASQRAPGNYWWENGYYIIYGVNPGSHTLQAAKDGYITRSSNALTVDFHAGSRMDMALTPEGQPAMNLTGTVKNVLGGAPIPRARVWVQDNLVVLASDDGVYTIPDLPIGRSYDLRARKDGYRERLINGIPLSGPADESLTQNIALTSSSIEVGSIAGFVVNAMSGSQLGGARVSLSDGMVKHTDGYGGYSIDDVPIGYPFTISATAYSGYLARSLPLIRANEGMDFALMPEGSTPGTISGTVTRTDNGAAIGEVWVRAGFGLVTRTASDGSYTLDNLPEGDYYLQAHKAAFESATAQLNLTGGGSPTQDFTLKHNAAAGWVWGYVTNVTNGNRIDGAVISVAGKTVASQRAPGNYWWENGHYIIYGVNPGSYTLQAAKDGYITRSSNALTVDFHAGSRMDMALTPEGQPAMNLTGTVKNVLGGAPIPKARVWVQSNLVVLAGDDGVYTIPDLPIGRSYDLRASKDGYRERLINGIPLSGPAGESLTQNIALTPSSIEVGSIGGFVVNAMSGSQLGGVKVSLSDGMVKHTDGYGGYSIDDVPIGYPFSISATAYSGYLARSLPLIRANEGMDFALMPEGSTPGTISGTVTRTDNGVAIAEAWVRAGFGLVTRTASDGTYTLDNLPEGDYYLQAHKAAFESATAQLNLPGGGSPTQDFTLKPNAAAGWVWGYVTNVTNGNRIDGAVISVAGNTVASQRRPGNYWWENGYYIIYGINPGSYTGMASHQAYQTLQKPITVSFQAETRTDFALTPRGAVESPLAEVYQPASGATVTGVVSIIGTATDTDFKQYKLEYEASAQAGVWNVIVDHRTTPVLGSLLANWDTTGLADGEYHLRLTAEDEAGNVSTAEVTVDKLAAGGTIAGGVILQGIAQPPYIALVTLEGTSISTLVDPETGDFVLREVPAGDYTIRVDSPGYLAAERGVAVQEGETTTLPAATLLGGDVNRDGIIDIYDLILSGANFNRDSSPW